MGNFDKKNKGEKNHKEDFKITLKILPTSSVIGEKVPNPNEERLGTIKDVKNSR